MKVFERKDYTTICGTSAEWKSLREKFKDDPKVSVLDLRPTVEAAETPLDKLPDTWIYRLLPISGSTVSEQDIDVLRREGLRHGKLILVAPNQTRACLLVLANQARIDQTSITPADTDGLEELEEEASLRGWLDSYLQRHQR